MAWIKQISPTQIQVYLEELGPVDYVWTWTIKNQGVVHTSTEQVRYAHPDFPNQGSEQFTRLTFTALKATQWDTIILERRSLNDASAYYCGLIIDLHIKEDLMLSVCSVHQYPGVKNWESMGPSIRQDKSTELELTTSGCGGAGVRWCVLEMPPFLNHSPKPDNSSFEHIPVRGEITHDADVLSAAAPGTGVITCGFFHAADEEPRETVRIIITALPGLSMRVDAIEVLQKDGTQVLDE